MTVTFPVKTIWKGLTRQYPHAIVFMSLEDRFVTFDERIDDEPTVIWPDEMDSVVKQLNSEGYTVAVAEREKDD